MNVLHSQVSIPAGPSATAAGDVGKSPFLGSPFPGPVIHSLIQEHFFLSALCQTLSWVLEALGHNYFSNTLTALFLA